MIERQDIKIMIDRLNGVECDTSDSHTIDDAISLLEDLGNEISANPLVQLSKNKLGAHWLEVAAGMIAYGDSEEFVMRLYGYVKQRELE